MAMLCVLGRDWKATFANFVRSVDTDLLISSPYVTQDGIDFVLNNLSANARAHGRVRVVTNLSPGNICQGATDPNAFLSLIRCAKNVEVIHLSRLHAKVYVADSREVIVTSANLTRGGLELNYEYGMAFSDRLTVDSVKRDITAYAAVGATLDSARIATYCEIAEKVRATYQKQLSAASKLLRDDFDKALRSAQDELARISMAGGAMHTVFARTILYLLNERGRLTTVQLHPLVAAIHPELCDNAVDRIIDGKRFGKKWKHAVRSAQQQLKKQGVIDRMGDYWVVQSKTPLKGILP